MTETTLSQNSSPRKKKKLSFIIAGLGLYLLSTGISYAAFKYLGVEAPGIISPLPVEEGRARIDPAAPKTEACPLTGEMFSKAERAIWEKRRPLGIMIENHADSRPQSGLSKADIVYEAVAEGGITRFLAIYFCRASAEDVLVGPVRSARTYYLDWVSEYADYPLYAHVGGANNFDGSGTTNIKARALEQIADYGWNLYNDLSGTSISFPTYWRDYERLPGVATEHTMYSTTDKLWAEAEKRGLTQTDEEGNPWNKNFVSWKTKEEAAEGERGNTAEIDFSFWTGEIQAPYKVRWNYDRAQNLYLRLNGDQPHQDLNNEQQLTAKVVVVLFSRETGPVDAHKHLLYQTTGKGQALIFQDGQVTKGTWEKEDRTERTLFSDQSGEEISFNGGPLWIEVLPVGNKVNY